MRLVSRHTKEVSMSDTPPSDQPTSQGSNFTTDDGGDQSGSASGPALQPEGGWLAINGSTDLSGCIVGNSDASISQIYVSNQPPPDGFEKKYAYCVWVYGQGPKGAGSGRLWLTFTDQTGSTYSLSLYSSDPAWHYVNYNSDSPGITQVSWGPWGP
jgi:hypothetical protein